MLISTGGEFVPDFIKKNVSVNIALSEIGSYSTKFRFVVIYNCDK